MRLDINLASQPYEDARQFWLRWGTALVVASILTLMLLVSTITGWYNARRDHQQIAKLRAQIAQRDQKRREAEEFLSRAENRTTRDQSQFINQLIERKSFSWTRVLEDLEKVMPTRVHLVSIHPELDDDNQLAIKMVVAGDSPERAIELARRMEDSRRFTRTHIGQESSRVSTTGDTVQLNINAIYVPETVYVPTSAPKAEIPKRNKP
jgi:type IV pilus assembly protein PilN